ncbi:MAG: HAD-IIIA family hydrolase [Paludibacteraceae bacterium]|nr:HAD-IIIA family hydrolase [Paludibacteraceae bacterium]
MEKKTNKYPIIRLFLTDVDGTLTDGGMYYSKDGDTMKRFYTRDGMGMQLLQQKGIKVGIITSETTDIIASRAQKLKVDYLVQGVRFDGKVSATQKICNELNISLEQVAYIGDDVNDRELLEKVGLAACPNDAHESIKSISGINIMQCTGGHGAVRDFTDLILSECVQ